MREQAQHMVAYDAKGEVIGCTYRDPKAFDAADTGGATFKPAPDDEECPSCEMHHKLGSEAQGAGVTCGKCQHGKSEHNGGVLSKCTHARCHCYGFLAKARDGEVDTEYTDNPRCPMCAEDISEPFEYMEGAAYTDGESSEIECPACSFKFKATTHVSYSYSTHPGDTSWDKNVDKKRHARKHAEAEANHKKAKAERAAKGEPMYDPTCPACGHELRLNQREGDDIGMLGTEWTCTCGAKVRSNIDENAKQFRPRYVNVIAGLPEGQKSGKDEQEKATDRG